MATPSPDSPPKRPRLSLQIKAIANGATGRTSRNLAAAVDVKSPTSFNTLSNVYATAVDRSTPVQEKAPQTAINSRPSLRLQTQEPSASSAAGSKERRSQTPYLGPYLDTPVTAQPISPAIPKQVYFPSAMTATPPMSAQPPDQDGARVFTFENPGSAAPNSASAKGVPQSATGQPRRSKTLPTNSMKLPYTHPRSLRSILRNSPLPPLSTKSPDSPRRQSLRLQEKAARRVAYNSPLTQTITTSKYTKSHIDLLADDATPTTPSASSDGEDLLDATMAYTGNETRDGGQTPGPFEEMRRRMAGLRASTPVTSSPTSAGIRKRGKKKEKKRRWVWTIGQDGEDADEIGSPIGGDPMDRSPEKKEAAVSVVPVVPAALPVEKCSVPVIAVPLPKKPRTRMQAALQAAVGASSGVAPAPAVAPAPVPVVQQEQPQPQEQPRVQEISQPAPITICTSMNTSPPTDQRDTTTPEPQTAIRHPQHEHAPIEPPTPSVESVVSTASTAQDSVFESSASFTSNTDLDTDGGEADVEMSDASSMFSDYCGEQYNNYTVTPFPKTDGLGGGRSVDVDGDMDMDMDNDTPTTATVAKPPVGFGGNSEIQV
ncbi:putative glucan 1, 4-alpha-glucosidase [Naviculisporaceae sp. PSN 640]